MSHGNDIVARNADTTISSAMSGGRILTWPWAKILTLLGANTNTGAWTVKNSGGRLVVGSTGSLVGTVTGATSGGSLTHRVDLLNPAVTAFSASNITIASKAGVSVATTGPSGNYGLLADGGDIVNDTSKTGCSVWGIKAGNSIDTTTCTLRSIGVGATAGTLNIKDAVTVNLASQTTTTGGVINVSSTTPGDYSIWVILTPISDSLTLNVTDNMRIASSINIKNTDVIVSDGKNIHSYVGGAGGIVKTLNLNSTGTVSVGGLSGDPILWVDDTNSWTVAQLNAGVYGNYRIGKKYAGSLTVRSGSSAGIAFNDSCTVYLNNSNLSSYGSTNYLRSGQTLSVVSDGTSLIRGIVSFTGGASSTGTIPTVTQSPAAVTVNATINSGELTYAVITSLNSNLTLTANGAGNLKLYYGSETNQAPTLSASCNSVIVERAALTRVHTITCPTTVTGSSHGLQLGFAGGNGSSFTSLDFNAGSQITFEGGGTAPTATSLSFAGTLASPTTRSYISSAPDGSYLVIAVPIAVPATFVCPQNKLITSVSSGQKYWTWYALPDGLYVTVATKP